MKLVLRDYQEEAVAAVVDGIDWGYKSLLVTAATGTGKTPCAASIVQIIVREWGKTLLFLAPRRELIQQAYLKIRDMCNLSERIDGRGDCEIDKEMGAFRFDPSAKVVVGCVNTCYKDTRLQDWTPDYIICDECHFVRTDEGMWKQLFERFPLAVRIGFTATAMRGDGLPVFHENMDGSIIQVQPPRVRGKLPPARDTRPEECAFHRHVFDYPLEDAVNDGWLVNPRGFVVKSDLDLSAVKSAKGSGASDGDFVQKDLNAALERTDKVVVDRINRAIGKWEDVARDRPTVVFCPSVRYAHWAADLWRQAGYTAAAYDCETETATRDCMRQEVKDRNIQVVCNFGLFTHGTDVPEWSCVVILRPTESTGLLSQMIGRGTRPDDAIAHILGTLPSAEDRQALIASSRKPDLVIIDVVDICGKHKLATLPTVLGLPPNLDLQGHTITEAAALVKEFEAVKSRAVMECPATYEQLEATLQRIDILDNNGGKSRNRWLVAEDGSYRHGHLPPGYQASLERDGDTWALSVVDTQHGEIIYSKETQRRKGELSAYFESADAAAVRHAEQHRKEHPMNTGMLVKLRNAEAAAERAGKRDPRLYYLRKAGFSDEKINTLHDKQVRAIVDKEREKYWAAKEAKKGGQRAMGIGA